MDSTNENAAKYRACDRWHFFAESLRSKNLFAQALDNCGNLEGVAIDTATCAGASQPVLFGYGANCDGTPVGSVQYCAHSACIDQSSCAAISGQMLAMWPPRPCGQCVPHNLCTDCERPGQSRPGEPQCTRPSCIPENCRGQPVAVGSGLHTLEPISLFRDNGSWGVPLELTLYYSQANKWSGLRDERLGFPANSPRIEGSYLGSGWSHTFSEAIIVQQVEPTNGSLQRIPPAEVTWMQGNLPCPGIGEAHLVMNANATMSRIVLYRTPNGDTHEFFLRNGGNFLGTDFCGPQGGGWVRLANHRGSPYRFEYLSDDFAGTVRFRVFDLVTGIKSEFDSLGRIVRKTAPTPSGRFGWTVNYDAAGAIASVVHDSGRVLQHQPSGLLNFFGRWFMKPINGMDFDPANEIARINDPPVPGFPPQTGTLQRIQFQRTNTSWTFEYATNGNATDLDKHALTRATEPSGVVHEFVDHQTGRVCNPGASSIQRRARAASDPNGGWEFRRAGTAQTDLAICPAGPVPSNDPTRGFNPCFVAPLGGATPFAVLDLSQIERSPAGTPITCSYNPDNSGGCGTGFTCSKTAISLVGFGSAPRCVRFACQGTASTNPDQVDDLACPSGGCPVTHINWTTIGGPGQQALVRMSSKVESGITTTFNHDQQGRLIARCIGDTDSVVSVLPSSCPLNAQYDVWTYDAINSPSIANSWAFVEHKRRSIATGQVPAQIANPFLTETYTYDPANFLLNSITTTGNALTSVLGASPSFSQQARTMRFSYDATTGAITHVDTGAANDAGSIDISYFAGNLANNDRFMVNTVSVRSEVPGAAAKFLTTTYASYTPDGRPQTMIEPTGVVNSVVIDPVTQRLMSRTRAGRTFNYFYRTDGRLQSVQMPNTQGVVFEYATGFGPPSRVHLTDTPNDLLNGVPNASDVLDRMLNPLEINRQTRIFRRSGGVDTLAFDSRAQRNDMGRIGTVQSPVSPTENTTITYNPDGTVQSTRTGAGQCTEFDYDSLRHLTQVRRGTVSGAACNPQQTVTVHTYGGSDLIETVEFRGVNPGSPTEVIAYRYSDFGELQESSAPDLGIRRFLYNQHGRLTDQLEADGSHTRITYDRADRPVNIEHDVDSIGAVQFRDNVRLTWDQLAAGQVCPAAGDCNNLTGRLAYAESDSIVGLGANTMKTFYGYTAAGEVSAETMQNPLGTFRTGYTYDFAGRLVDLKFPFGTGDSAHFSYGGSGPATQHLVSRIENWFGGGFEREVVNAVTRTAGGAITKMWYQEQGFQVPNPGQPSVERSYRTDGRLQSVKWRSGSNASADLGDYTYSYYDSGQLSGISNSNPGGQGMGTMNFKYDILGRLTCATSSSNPASDCQPNKPGLIALYSYDERGNRTSAWWSGNANNETETFTFDPARPMRLQQWTRSDWPATRPMNVSYSAGGVGLGGAGQRVMEQREANGANEPKVTRSWAYHTSGSPALVQVIDFNGITQSNYGYDHRGMRRSRVVTVNGVQTKSELFFYDLAGHLIGTLTVNANGTRTAELNYWIDNEMVHRRMMNNVQFGGSPGERMYFYNDQTMTPRVGVQVSDSNGMMAGRYRSSNEPFLAGAPQVDPANSGLTPVRMRFPGQWEDSGTSMSFPGGAVSNSMSSLVHNTARVYDPGYGGYAQSEPLLARGSTTAVGWFSPWSGYAGHQPAMVTDGNGEVPLLLYGLLVGVAWAFSSDDGRVVDEASQKFGATMLIAGPAMVEGGGTLVVGEFTKWAATWNGAQIVGAWRLSPGVLPFLKYMGHRMKFAPALDQMWRDPNLSASQCQDRTAELVRRFGLTAVNQFPPGRDPLLPTQAALRQLPPGYLVNQPWNSHTAAQVEGTTVLDGLLNGIFYNRAHWISMTTTNATTAQ